MYLALVLLVLACGHPPPPQVPGSTPRAVAHVTIQATDGGAPGFDFKVLMDKLAHRPGNFIIPPRNFNAYRLGEDQRRIATYASNYGFFDIAVSEPVVTTGKDDKVSIDWRVAMGEKYRIGTLTVQGAPAEASAELMATIPFRAGSDVAVNENRLLRHKLADLVRWHGYAHARVYSRAWVDRKKKSVEWYYFVDPGPKTVIASIEVRGNRRVATSAILERSGLIVGQPYSLRERDRAQLALMDSGSVISAVVDADEDVHKGPPELPDSGGLALTDASGQPVARDLARALNVKIAVVEAPRREFRLEAGTEADPSRADVFAGTRTVFRDLLTNAMHVVTEGKIGYGYQLGDSNQPLGLYGHALVQVVKAGALDSRFDVRATASLQHTLFPDAAVREYAAGPGLRRALAGQLYLDMQLLAFRAREVDPLALGDDQRASAMLATSTSATGAKLIAALVHDARDSGIEATDGHFVSGYAEFSPDALGARHRWLRLSGDARIFHPISPVWSVAARGAGSWVLAANDAGLPLQSRLFGGGAYGFRGYGRQAFSPEIDGLIVGGTSLVESSLELRHLPFQKLYGLIGFLDVGGIANDTNPFADGASSVIGLGARARPFYIPIALDLGYRYLDRSDLVSPIQWSAWSLFLRLGEAF